jgi:SagB-type dehydrogenase family enzyme
MKFKSLTFGTLFLFLSVNSFSQTQTPQKATSTTSTQTTQKPTSTTSTQTPQKATPATSTQTPQRVTPAAGTQTPQRTTPATGTQTPQRTTPAAGTQTPQRAVPATDNTQRRITAEAEADAAIDADMRELHLTPPERGGGRPLMEVLNERQSIRKFSPRELEPHIMSGLLWAANGVNRREDIDGETGGAAGKRTAPSARDAREIDIYVVTPFGVYLYIPDDHKAKSIKNGDYRKEILAGKSEFACEAPVVLVYVASAKKMEKFDVATKDIYAAVDCGFISQNVYLYCASERLATVILGNFNKEATIKALGLRNDKVLFVQPVGHWD